MRINYKMADYMRINLKLRVHEEQNLKWPTT